MTLVFVGAGIVYGDLFLQHHLMAHGPKDSVPRQICSHIVEKGHLYWKYVVCSEVENRRNRVNRLIERISDQDDTAESRLRPAFVCGSVLRF